MFYNLVGNYFLWYPCLPTMRHENFTQCESCCSSYLSFRTDRHIYVLRDKHSWRSGSQWLTQSIYRRGLCLNLIYQISITKRELNEKGYIDVNTDLDPVHVLLGIKSTYQIILCNWIVFFSLRLEWLLNTKVVRLEGKARQNRMVENIITLLS